jgi:hypothetical protein
MKKKFTQSLCSIVLLAVFLFSVYAISGRASGTLTKYSIKGVVVDANGPVAGARVRVRATDNTTMTHTDGSFILTGLDGEQEVEIAAWAEGYYIASVFTTPPVEDVFLTLRPYHTTDNPDYEWAAPDTCDICHPMITPQWAGNAHGGAISNLRFYSLYNGTDISGTISISPGYQTDFPGTSGNCADCHAPGAALDGFMTTNMNDVYGLPSAGIHCDYCHKIGGVYINPATSSVYPNAPGVLSQRVLRPPEGDDIFFGPYDDIKDPDTYLPVMSESQFCAPCHQFSFWGTPIYESYNEWLNSPYAEEGVTCQACHMPPNGDNYFALAEEGGLWHKAEVIPSHQDLGLKDIEFMSSTVEMTLTAQVDILSLVVTATLKNVNAGHHVPTDYPGRHMLLVITALDEEGRPLSLASGPVIPGWGGEQAGLPGVVYAKVLQDYATGEYPVISYWKPSFILSDNRLAAMETDAELFTFLLPQGSGDIQIYAELLFRRNFQAEMKVRGWNSPDIVMQARQLTLIPKPVWQLFLPLAIR